MSRIGLFGGTFDPIHNGHLGLAKQAIKQAQLDELWFIPSFAPVNKEEPVTSFLLRVKMIEKAIKPYRKMKCCPLEANLQAPSYTIKTVEYIKKQDPHDEFFWVVGFDQYAKLDRWYEIDKLKKLVTFIAIGDNLEPQTGCLVYKGFHDDTRSSMIKQGDLYKTPKQVRKFILENGLYIKDIVKNNESEKRYLHSCSVANVCMLLAQKHGLDINKAYLMGMLHDIAKEWDKDEAKRLMEIYYPDKVNINHHIYHQYLGKLYLQTNLGIYDNDILEAVSHHVIGDSMNKYAMILFIADKIEPTRGYDNTKHLAISLKDLREGVAYVKREQQDYLEKVEGIHV